jgi:hypothetical protein
MGKDGNRRFSSKLENRILVTLLVIGLAGFGGFYFRKYQDLKKQPLTAGQQAQAENDRNIAEVSKLYALPQDEKPSVTTIKDKKKLTDQPFFNQAENGDVTLIYLNAKLVILYRPSSSQIINVSSMSIQSDTRVKVIGTLAARQNVEKALTAAQIVYADAGNAKTTYTLTLVIDITGQSSQQASTIAVAVGGRVSSLPAGESIPANTDILVIAGTTQPAP